MNNAFIVNALPSLSQRKLPSPTRARRPNRPAIATASLSSRVAQRARDDIAHLEKAFQTASRSLLSAAAVGVVLGTALLTPALAEIPDTAPGTFFFDEAAVVQKSSASLFSKAAINIKTKEGITVRFVFAKALPYEETPDEYANELAQQWKLGASDVLFVASPKLARAGSYVGADVPYLTPDIAQSICNQTYAVPAGDERYGAAVLEVSNRLIPVLSGQADPGPPEMAVREVVQNFKTKEETKSDRKKYITVVGGVLVISFIAPIIQTYWYVRDD